MKRKVNLSILSAGVFRIPHGCSHLQKWNPANRVKDGREAEAAAPVGKKSGVLPVQSLFIPPRLDDQRYKIAAGRVSNWKNYIKTVLDVTGRNTRVKMKPGIALFVDGDAMGLNEIMLAREECKKLGIKFWFINESVKTGDLLEYQAMMRYLREIGAE
tara:strand:+ start:1207 stop:1680 length:474 start_codon:yes stop_codon:yes gene_type:complete